MELVLRDLEAEGKLLQLVVYDPGPRLLDLAAAEEISALRQGEHHPVPRRQQGLPPADDHHPGADRPPSWPPARPKAKVIDALSRRQLKRAPYLVGPGPRAPLLSLRPRVRAGSALHRGAERLILESVRPRLVGRTKAPRKRKPSGNTHIVAWILKAGQKDLEEMRKIASDQPVAADGVAAVRPGGGHGPRPPESGRGRTIMAGDPPLTEMAASAFCELYAYSRLLRRDASGASRKRCRQRCRRIAGRAAARPGPSAAERPGGRHCAGCGWCCAPGQPRRRRPRAAVERIVQARSDVAVGRMLKHNVLMNIQQQTFNQYMWSRSYNYQPATGGW